MLKPVPDQGYYGDYDDLLDTFGLKKEIEVSDDDYQGDTRVLFSEPGTNRLAYLNFGWGSCSGCDALQGCNNVQEATELRDQLYNDLEWFDNATAAYNWFVARDWLVQYSWHYQEQHQFLKQVVEFLDHKLCDTIHESTVRFIAGLNH